MGRQGPLTAYALVSRASASALPAAGSSPEPQANTLSSYAGPVPLR